MRHVRALSMKATGRLSVAVLAAAAVGAINMPAANASSGGGCAAANGSTTVCISASGSHLEPDYYINNSAGTCSSVAVWVDDLNDNSLTIWSDSTVNSGCVTGHHGPWALDSSNTSGGVVNGHRYVAYMQINGSSGTAKLESPAETLSY